MELPTSSTDPLTVKVPETTPSTSSSETPQSPAPKPNKISRNMIVAVALGLVVIMVLAWVLMPKHMAPKALTNISVRLAWVNNPEFAGMYAAQEQGYYKAAGLNVELKEFQHGTDINKEVASGVVDYGVSTPLEVILARDKGEKNKAIAVIYQTSAFSYVAPIKSNIHTPSDFKGKILGVSGGNNESKVTYAALLADAGATKDQATLKTVDFDILKVFQDDQADIADIYRNDQTYLLDKANIPYTQIFPEQYGFTIYGDVLITSDAMISKHPVQTDAFVQATLKGWQYILDHQTEALAILSRHDNVLYKDPAYVKYDLKGTLQLIRPTGDQSLGGMQYVPWNRAYIATKASGLLQTELSANEFYTTEFLK